MRIPGITRLRIGLALAVIWLGAYVGPILISDSNLLARFTLALGLATGINLMSGNAVGPLVRIIATILVVTGASLPASLLERGIESISSKPETPPGIEIEFQKDSVEEPPFLGRAEHSVQI